MVKMSLKDLLVIRIIAGVPVKIWTGGGAALLTCFIVYCFYGSFTAFSLVAVTILCLYPFLIKIHRYFLEILINIICCRCSLSSTR